MPSMKKLILIVIGLSFHTLCFAQTDIRDSVFVRIDRLRPEKLSFQLREGKVFHTMVFIKNRYESLTSFFSIKNNSNLVLVNKKSVDHQKVLSYDAFNDRLNHSFLDILFYTKIYLVLSESKESYLVLWVQPKLPEALNKH
jgi:hypothetical protein